MQKKETIISRFFTPKVIVVKAFLVAIVIGAILLALPFSHNPEMQTTPLTALFTATSATCVTGLTIVEVASFYSTIGQIIILFLVQLGGLGIMTFSTLLLLVAGKNLGFYEELAVTDSLGSTSLKGFRLLLKRALFFTASLEGMGTLILAWRLHTHYGCNFSKSVYLGIFHSVSAFCNAGFGLFSDSLTGFRNDPIILVTIALLVMSGGLGFIVLQNLSSLKPWKRSKLQSGRLSLHSKIVIGTSLTLTVIGFLIFFVLESQNTLSSLTLDSKLLCAFFQSVTPRSAGFSTIDISTAHPATKFATIILMFIGGSPASTAGGLKTTTLFVLLLTVIGMIRGKENISFAGKTIASRVVRAATVAFMLSLLWVVFLYGIILIAEYALPGEGSALTPGALLFETVSAFTTTGLSSGTCALMNTPGKICLIICMFVGRLGPLTIALIVGTKSAVQSIRYPEEEVIVG